MAAKARKPARAVAQWREPGAVWIDHAAVTADDREWLRDAAWITLWNVTVPVGFLASLPRLWGVDLRGGSGADLAGVAGCEGLRCLVVNQVRGMADLSLLPTFGQLELLALYGLKQVVSVPSLAPLTALRRINLGQLRGLPELDGMLDAPGLEELELLRWVNVTADDVARLKAHPTLARFGWWGADVPVGRWVPMVEEVGLPAPEATFPKDWIEARGTGA